MKHLVTIVIIILAAFAAGGCSTSAIYDPTLRLPARQLKGAEVQGMMSWGMLPESRPDAIGHPNQHAMLFDARVGLSNRVTMQARTFIGVDDLSGETRWGVGGSLYYAITPPQFGWRTAVQGSVAASMNDNNIRGFGGALNYVLYSPELFDGFQPYASVGGILAFSTESLSYWGLAQLLHLGASYEFTDDAGINLEFVSVAQYNHEENKLHVIGTPTLGAYVRF